MAMTYQEDLDWKKQLEDDLMAFAGPEQQQTPVAQQPDPAAGAPTPAAQPAGNQPAMTGVPQTMQMMAPGTRTMAAPPPPPPPPTPPPPPSAGMSGGFPQMLENYATEWMGQPNRYLSDFVTQTREAGDQRRVLAGEGARRNLDELHSSRGTVASTIEEGGHIDLERGLRADMAAEEAALTEALARYESMDRLAAGEFGLDVYGEQGRQGTANRDLDLRGRELDLEEYLGGRSLDLEERRDDREFGLGGRELDLRAQQLQQEAAQAGRSLDLQQARDLAQQEYQRGELGLSGRELDLQETVADREYGLAGRDLDLRAQQLQQEAELEGRALSLQEARDQAQQEYQQGSLGLERDALQQRESEFARSLNMDEREFSAQQEQFSKQFGEQVATRLQQDEHFARTLASEDARFAVDKGLREKALALQEQDMSMEDAYRTAALDQEKELQLGAQALTQAGMEKDDAYRYAALSQDATFRDRTLSLQEEGMDLDEAFRQAELEFREESTRRATDVDLLGVLAQHGGLTDESRDVLADYLGEDAGGDGDAGGGGNGVFLEGEEGVENGVSILDKAEGDFQNVLRYGWDSVPFGEFTNSEFQRFLDKINDADIPDMAKRMYVERAGEQRKRASY